MFLTTKKSIHLFLLFIFFIIAGATGYFATHLPSQHLPFLNPPLSPSPIPTPPISNNLPIYPGQKNPTPTAFVRPLRYTKDNKILVQFRGRLENIKNNTANLLVDINTYSLIFPSKLRLDCQPTHIRANNNPDKIIDTRTAFFDLAKVDNFTPNQTFANIRNFFIKNPDVTLIGEDTGDHHTFLVKYIVGFGCYQNTQ